MTTKPGLYRSYRQAARSLTIAVVISVAAAAIAVVVVGTLAYLYIRAFG